MYMCIHLVTKAELHIHVHVYIVVSLCTCIILMCVYMCSVYTIPTCRGLEFVVCERAHFISMCSLPGSGMKLVEREVEMQGYRVAILQDWALNRARYHIHVVTGRALFIASMYTHTHTLIFPERLYYSIKSLIILSPMLLGSPKFQ